MKYKCHECGYEFNEPRKYYGQWLEFWGSPCREEYDGCPICSGSFDECIVCYECEETFCKSDAECIDDNGTDKYCCFDCYKNLNDRGEI